MFTLFRFLYINNSNTRLVRSCGVSFPLHQPDSKLLQNFQVFFLFSKHTSSLELLYCYLHQIRRQIDYAISSSSRRTMELFGLFWQVFVFVIMTIFQSVANVADEVMFTLEDYEVSGKIAKVRHFQQGPDQILR